MRLYNHKSLRSPPLPNFHNSLRHIYAQVYARHMYARSPATLL